MKNMFCRKPLWESTLELTDVAGGRKPADLLIVHAKLVNVCTHEIEDDMFTAVSGGRIVFTGKHAEWDPSFCIGEKTQILDAGGRYLAPGFLDGHIHVESSMLTVGEYARAVIPHGTTGIYMDPHEICNVLGIDGVRYMMEDAARTPLKTMLTIPSCVPAMPGFEDTGAAVGAADIAETMKWENCVGLGEMMNDPGVTGSDPDVHAILAETLKADKIVTGHYSMPDTAAGLNGYIASGVRCCHESTTAEQALEKMRRGMYAMLREGSAWHDLEAVAKAVAGRQADSRYACLVSDDAHPHTLYAAGHLDHIMRRAMEEGIDPVTAIQMVTINCAQCFQMDHELGSIAPGKCADMVLLDDLERMKVWKVWIDGRLVASEGQMTEHYVEYSYPDKAVHSVHISPPIGMSSLQIPAQHPEKNSASVHVIEVIPEKVGAGDVVMQLPVKNGMLEADPDQDVLKAVVFERHHGTGKTGKGFVKGFGIRKGAMASTVAHDAHNLLVIGTNDEDMMLAAQTLVKSEGGMAVAADGKLLGVVPLPIAGLMSELSCEEMSADVEKLEAAWKETGCSIQSPFMTMALISLACLPEIRLTDRGLVDSINFRFLDLETE